MVEEKKYSRGEYIPDDHPDLEKRHEDRVKSRKVMDKITSLIPFKSKKLKKAIKENKDKPLKKENTKALEDMYINLKSKKMTKSEGSFAKGGRAGLKGGGMSTRGLGKAFMKGGKV